MAPTQADTEITFGLGCGAYELPHYANMNWSDGDADSVGWYVKWMDANTGTYYTVDHKAIMRGLNELIRNKDFRSDWKHECYNFLLDTRRDDTDFDGVSASAVIETAAYGKVMYS